MSLFCPAPVRAGRSDLPEVMQCCEVWAEGPIWPAEAWTAYVAAVPETSPQRALWLLREADERLAGWLAGMRLGDSAELEYLLVDPARRRRGVARRLLQWWLTAMRVEGATEAWLEVRAADKGAQALYAAEGFTGQGVRRGYYQRPEDDAVVMRRAL